MLQIVEQQTARCCTQRRAGVIVVKELMLLAVCLVSLFGLGTRSVNWMAFEGDHQDSRTRLARAASPRYVSRITTNQDGTKLWISRPLHSIVAVNRETGETDQGLMTDCRRLSRAAHSLNNSTSLLVWMDGTAELYPQGIGGEPVQSPVLNCGDSFDIAADVSADGAVALFVLRKGLVYGWFIGESGVEEFAYSLPTSSDLARACLNREGSRLFVAREDGTAGIHDVLTGAGQEFKLTLRAPCTSAVWSADGRSILVATKDGCVSLIDAVTGATQWERALAIEHIGLSYWADSIAISRDGKHVAAASSHSKTFDVWDLDSDQPPYPLAGHEGVIRSLEFGHDNQTLYSGSLDGTVREWSLASYSQRRIID
ncbi:MAG: hypothetical protein JWN70_289 [Planctomycetaceae bacterium]|nr:hypothetical protein [Planctomycetaceae bacterium]